jgi:hypothetical protein
MKDRIVWLVLIVIVLSAGILPHVLADTAETTLGEKTNIPQTSSPVNYLFIHDASVNMRRRSRIAIMQSSIRSMLRGAAPGSYAGLRLFGHRFPLDGPDVCEDTELIIPPGPILTVREDFDIQLNLLSQPVIGGGAPVGLALRQSLDDLREIPGQKEIFLYLVDLMKCETPDPIQVIRSACEVPDLHLTMVGFGLKSDLQTLEEEGVPNLSCVDIVNLVTNEDANALPDRLLTRYR